MAVISNTLLSISVHIMEISNITAFEGKLIHPITVIYNFIFQKNITKALKHKTGLIKHINLHSSVMRLAHMFITS